ncbi:MAG: hypothetical protein AABZ39_06900 [Spirochaetota bacterium]
MKGIAFVLIALTAVLSAQTPAPSAFDTTRDVIRAKKQIEMGSKDKKNYETVIKGSLILNDFQQIIELCNKPEYIANIAPLLRASALADAYIGVKNFDEALKTAETIPDEKEKSLRFARAYYAKFYCNKAMDYYRQFLDKGGKFEALTFRNVDVQGYGFDVPEYWITSPGRKVVEGDWEISAWTFFSLYGIWYQVNTFYYTAPTDEDVKEKVVKTLKARIASDYDKAGMLAVMERGKLVAVKKSDVAKTFKGFFGKSGGTDPKAADVGAVWYSRDNKRESSRFVDIYLLPDAATFTDSRMGKSLLQIVAMYYYYNSAASDRHYKTELEAFLDRLISR